MTPRQLHILRLASVFEPAADDIIRRSSYDPIGGMQNHTASLTRALDRLGVSQTVVTSRLGGPAGTTRFGQHATVARVGLQTPKLRQFWAAAATPALFNGAAVDLVHAHQGEDVATLPLAVAASRRYRCPLVVTVHCSVRYSVFPHGVRSRVLHGAGGVLEQRLLPRADCVVVLTPTSAARLAPMATRTIIIPSGVESTLFPGAPSSLLAAIPRPRVTYLGRLASQKDVPTLIRAFGLLQTPASLVLVGDGPHRDCVGHAIRALPDSARQRVYRFGFRPHREVPGLLAAADVLVLPSIYEEMGSILVEAMQAGVPVVATRVGGIPDVVQDGVTGLLVPPAQPAALATAIDRLVSSPLQRATMREESLRRAACYDWDRLAQQVHELYDDVLAARRCSASSVSARRSTV
jgi:2-deoxystreptamine N-acetyl-D-glucosaminyltransferase/2-deoxystreptamine glucosyltransferase